VYQADVRALADFRQHLVDVAGRERIVDGPADRFQFFLGSGDRLAAARFPKRPTHPFSNGQIFPSGDALNIG